MVSSGPENLVEGSRWTRQRNNGSLKGLDTTHDTPAEQVVVHEGLHLTREHGKNSMTVIMTGKQDREGGNSARHTRSALRIYDARGYSVLPVVF